MYDKKSVGGGWSDQVNSSQSEREMGGGSGGAACSFLGSWCEPVRLIPDTSTRKSFPCPKLHRHSEHWPEALLTMADIRFESRELSDVESDTQLVVLLPDQTVMMAFDAVFSTKDHAFTLAGHFDHWLAVLYSADNTAVLARTRPIRPEIWTSLKGIQVGGSLRHISPFSNGNNVFPSFSQCTGT